MKIWLALVVVASVVCIHDAKPQPKEVLVVKALGNDLGHPVIARKVGEISRNKLVTKILLPPGVVQKFALVELVVGDKRDIPEIKLLKNYLTISFRRRPLRNTLYKIIVKGQDLNLRQAQTEHANKEDAGSETDAPDTEEKSGCGH